MTTSDQTDETLLRCALRQCECERDDARIALASARRDRDAWVTVAAAGVRPPRSEALTAAHRETIRGAAEYLRNLGDFRLACDLLEILAAAGEVKP